MPEKKIDRRKQQPQENRAQTNLAEKCKQKKKEHEQHKEHPPIVDQGDAGRNRYAFSPLKTEKNRPAVTEKAADGSESQAGPFQ